jgi:hypothetical protein
MYSIIVNGEVDPNHLARMASQQGVEPHEMAAQIATAENGFRDVMTNIVEGASIDTEAFGAFIEADPVRGNKMMETARAMVMTNDTSGLNALVEDFYTQADRFMPEETRAALTEAGYGYEDTPEGLRVILNTGTKVSFAVAVKQGIIKFSRG